MQFTINPDITLDGWTQSELGMMDNCGKQWFWRYHELMALKGKPSWFLLVGSAMHKALEEMYLSAGQTWEHPAIVLPEGCILDPKEEEKLAYWNHVVPAMMTAYAQHHVRDFDVFNVRGAEEIMRVEYRGYTFTGMIDLRFAETSQGYDWIMDHKSASRLDLGIKESWNFKFQFMFYLWLIWKGRPDLKLKGYYINGIKKPELRISVSKGETLPAFAERCRQDMVYEPQKYFYREPVPMSTPMLEFFEKHVLGPKIDRLDTLHGKYGPDAAGAIAHNMNTNMCVQYGHPCEFVHLCRYGVDTMDFMYEQRNAKHEELIVT